MDHLNGKRIIISGLVSSKLNLNEHLTPVRNEIKRLGGEIVGELVQRRGVSRSKRPRGSAKLDLPLSSRTYISTGKVDELRKIAGNLNPDIIVFINKLTDAQIVNLENLIETKIEISRC